MWKKVFSLVLAVAALAVVAVPALAAKPGTCATIKDGTILDKFGNPIGLGYNKWGYNYEAHMFNGMYCDSYGNADWCQQFKNVSLMMKWSDAWLSNKDCNNDHILDRPIPYMGSGAWLTNHASGTYMSSWKLNGNYILSFDYLGSQYVHDMIVTTATDGTFSGTGGYPSGESYSTTWKVTGTITGNDVKFHVAYDGSSYTVDATGFIGADGTLVGDKWSSNALQEGTWTATVGVATKLECTVEDFVKIVAVPKEAILVDGMWLAPDGSEIGPTIWGEFAIIQEKGNDSCGEYGVLNYKGSKPGLGNW